MPKKYRQNTEDDNLSIEFEDEEIVQEQNGPVTVLGMTFANDDERRAYFREQLRAKLPELRNIEGFPIGSDDDIINLSDPPYYTACPNPWLNDFIAEWEQEKLQLEAEGKRLPNVEVTEPYAADVSEGKRNPIYDAHSYHTKVPHPAIMRYILNYTQPGDIVFDGFCGTGMTGVASFLCGKAEDSLTYKINDEFNKLGHSIQWGNRHAIISDLSPVASLISAEYNTPSRSRQTILELSKILESIKSEFGWMYETEDSYGIKRQINYTVWSDVFICPHCGNDVVFYDAAVQEDGKVLDSFPCPHCKCSLTKKTLEKKWQSIFDHVLEKVCQTVVKIPVLINYSIGKRGSNNKKPDAKDLDIISKASSLAQSFNITTERMMEGSEARRNDRQGLTHVHHFYFDRTLVILQKILSRKGISKELRFLINAQLVNISKLNRFRPGVSFPYNPLSGTLYIGSQISEANAIIAFQNKLKKLDIVFSLLDAHNCVSINSATSLFMPSNSVDYIFTDPPFGANISYSELNYLQECWLKLVTNYETEAIENNSHNKTVQTYSHLISKSISEFYRILKPGKWMTVEFSNTSAAIWNAIQNAITNAGFIIVSVAALDKQQGSFKAVTTTTAVKQDLIISCFKPTNQMLEVFKFSDDTNKNVWDFVDELITHLPVHIERGQKTTSIIERSPKILYDRLISFYVQHGYPVPLNAQAFQAGLRERYLEIDGMFFTSSQAVKYNELKRTTDGFQPNLFFVDSEQGGIHWLNNELETPQTYQEIQPKWLQAINGVRKHDILPELKQILEENFIQDKDKRWRRPNLQDDVDLEALRQKSLMREFKVYVETANKPNGKIKEARVEALRAGFKQCYRDKDFATIIRVGDRIPSTLLQEDEQLLQFYQIAVSRQ